MKVENRYGLPEPLVRAVQWSDREKALIPCKFCGKPTGMLGTEMCDSCWEVEHRIYTFLLSQNGRQFIKSALANATRLANKKPTHLVHGLSRTRTYRSWRNMNVRCADPKSKSFGRYGAKGITVCERWRKSFSNFLEDMGEAPLGHTIDRKNNALGYFKENCRWATRLQQARNRSNNHFLTINGETHCLAEWGRIFNVNPYTIASRLRRGWTGEKLFQAS